MIQNKIGEEGEIMEFDTVDPKWITIKLANGIVLQLKVEVTAVMYMGYKYPNGMASNIPMFNVSSQTIVRPQHIPREFYRVNAEKDNRSYID